MYFSVNYCTIISLALHTFRVYHLPQKFIFLNMVIIILLLRKHKLKSVYCSAWFSLRTQHVYTQFPHLSSIYAIKMMYTGTVQLVNFSFRFFILEGNTPIKSFSLYFFSHTFTHTHTHTHTHTSYIYIFSVCCYITDYCT